MRSLTNITGPDEIFTQDDLDLLDPERVEDLKVQVALAPVRCIDCGAYIPLGWVFFGASAPKCSGTRSHRVSNEVVNNIIDRIVNDNLASQEA